jgi:hypothetical protein
MSTSLEEERRALLERMRASREDCRSRFPPSQIPGRITRRPSPWPILMLSRAAIPSGLFSVFSSATGKSSCLLITESA